MSIFDRLGNLGKGLIQNVFNPDEEGATPGEYQERLRRAFEEGILTAVIHYPQLALLVTDIPGAERG
ncbi:MAG: hypothetical protein AAFV53_30110, partial [Myxococcota bacterium]